MIFHLCKTSSLFGGALLCRCFKYSCYGMKYLGIKGCKQSPCKLSWQLFGNIIAPVGIVVISATRCTHLCGRGGVDICGGIL